MSDIKLGFVYPKTEKVNTPTLTTKEFREKISEFIGGPEHNAYYDVDNILEICLNVMTKPQKYKAFTIIKKQKS